MACRLRGPHADHSDKAGTCWENSEWLASRPDRKRHRGHREALALARDVARRATRETTVGPPLARSSDPATSHEAARRYEPRRATAKGRVLWYLRERTGEWVDAPVLTQPEVGGFAGTRRLRELRDDGWPIETRPKPGAESTWQHRLVEDEA